MASSMILTVKSDKSQADLKQFYQLNENKDQLGGLALARLFAGFSSGKYRGVVDVQTASAAPVAASATVTLSGVAADETCVIGGVTLTAKASPSGEAQFDQSGDDTADALSLATIINAHSTLSQVVVATPAAAVVTITCLSKGVVGNFIALVGDTGMTASAATLESGTGGAAEAATTYELGLSA